MPAVRPATEVVILSEAKNPRISLAAARPQKGSHNGRIRLRLYPREQRLYIGVTTDLDVRVREHKNKAYPHSFTARYSIDQLVYFERFTMITAAIQREKQLKGWLRQKKIALIVANNPTWEDLSAEWGKPTDPFCEESMRVPRRFGDL